MHMSGVCATSKDKVMRLDIKKGARQRTGNTWTRVDQVLVDGRLLKGCIRTTGRRKHAETVITCHGTETKRGSDPYWLISRNGLSTETSAA